MLQNVLLKVQSLWQIALIKVAITRLPCSTGTSLAYA